MATYTVGDNFSAFLRQGDILLVPYSGKARKITLPAGRHKLQLWGAQGGGSRGGKGGYVTGVLTLARSMDTWLYVGQSGAERSSSAPFGGGGRTDSKAGSSGGGGTDVRLRTDSLFARVAAAGGGGGWGWGNEWYAAGGAAGGTSGSDGVNAGYNGGGASTSNGGSGYNSGGFGYGGTGHYSGDSYGIGGGGGGGFFGGGGSNSTYSYQVTDTGVYYSGSGGGGGGGSSYVYMSSSAGQYPAGCLLDASCYLAETDNRGGGASMPAPGGGTETGHAGDGYIIITVLERSGIAVYHKTASGWVPGASLYGKDSSGWHEANGVFIKTSAGWKEGT